MGEVDETFLILYTKRHDQKRVGKNFRKKSLSKESGMIKGSVVHS